MTDQPDQAAAPAALTDVEARAYVDLAADLDAIECGTYATTRPHGVENGRAILAALEDLADRRRGADRPDALTDAERAEALGTELDYAIANTVDEHRVAAAAVAYAVIRRLERAAPADHVDKTAATPERAKALTVVERAARDVIDALDASGVNRAYFEGRLEPVAAALEELASVLGCRA